MTRMIRASLALAALSLVALSQPTEAGPNTMPELVEELETWLDDNSPWPRRDSLPSIRMLPPSLAARRKAAPPHFEDAGAGLSCQLKGPSKGPLPKFRTAAKPDEIPASRL